MSLPDLALIVMGTEHQFHGADSPCETIPEWAMN